MTYNQQQWNNGPAGGTPLSASRLNHMEQGIKDLEDDIANLDNKYISNEELANVADPEDVAEFLAADAVANAIYGYLDHGEVSGALTIDPTVGTHVMEVTGPLLITLSVAPNGTMIALYVISGAEDITVDGISGLELTDGSFGTFVRIRDSWIVAAGGGAAGVSDSTPPTAITDLTVDPGDDGVTATVTFTPSTDPESTVKYRYRLYLTGDTAPSWPTSGPQFGLSGSPINLTGLSSGEDYTIEVQAYSAGGGADADQATFSTPIPPGWNVVKSDNFTGTDAAVVDGRTLPTGGGTWDVAADDVRLVLDTNRAKWAQHGETVTALVAMPGTALETQKDSRVSIDYNMATDGSGSQAEVGCGGTWDYASYDDQPQYARLVKDGTGTSDTCTLSLVRNAGTAPTLTLEAGKSFSGHPNTGKLTYENIGFNIKLYVNDVLIAQATSDKKQPNTRVLFRMSNRTAFVDNFVAEQYT